MEQLVLLLQDPTSLIGIIAGVGALVGAGVFAARRKEKPNQTPSPDSVESLGSPEEAAETDSAKVPSYRPEEPSDEAGAGEAVEIPSVGDDSVDEAEVLPAQLEVPESIPSRMERLRGRLARSGALGKALLSVLSRGDLSAADWEEIEDTLLMADLGLSATDELMEALRTRVKVEGTSDPDRVRELLAQELERLIDPTMDRSLNLERRDIDGRSIPATVLVVGVNGTGKTTTVGKLSRVLVAEGHSVLLGAADTFRAAAAQQLGTWGQRVGVDVIASEKEGADPASVAFETVAEGIARDIDVVLVDTAGRLQNKAGLMDELGKVKRVMEKHAPVSETLLVLDATTGQNALQQAKVFAEVAGVTGIVLTKLDGSAKGGIVVSVQRELGVPVKFVGLGEGVDDLAPFNPADFVRALTQ